MRRAEDAVHIQLWGQPGAPVIGRGPDAPPPAALVVVPVDTPLPKGGVIHFDSF